MHRITLATALVLVTATVPAGLPATGAEHCPRADVGTDEDTCATILSASLHGDAEGTDCRRANTCIAASGTGNATNAAGSTSCQALSDGCIALSLHGNASNEAGSYSCNSGCIAVSGTGNASNEAGHRSCSSGCIAVSGTGDASNEADDHSCGRTASLGCIAVSGTGNASNQAGESSCGFGCVAASGTGQASNEAGADSCRQPAASCDAITLDTLVDEQLPDGPET